MEFKEGQTVGIDLGTTFSAIAHLDAEGNPVALLNEEEEIETPSLILLAQSGHVIVGPSRTRAAMEDPDHVVERVKRHMGSTEYKRTFDGHEITPEFLSALILKKLRQDAEKRIGKIGNAVITVPYYFNDARRKATQDAGRISGLNVVDIINEPTAATLTYAWQRGELGAGSFDKPHMALVYDLGGGTFDVTVVNYTPTHFHVLATDGDVYLGGIDWNDRLLNYVADEFKKRHGGDPRESANASQVLRNDCDLAKIELSQKNQTSVVCRFEGKSVSVPVTREQFEQLTADLLQRTIDTTELVIEQAKIQASDLDAIVLVGGSTLMPKVPAMLEQVTGKKPYQGLSPHTAVAQGAAIHAAILEAKFRRTGSDLAEKVKRHLKNVKQDDVNSHSLGVILKHPKTGKPHNHVMIPRNTTLPVEKQQVFNTTETGQVRVTVRVIEGDAPDPAACSLIGNCSITQLPPNLPKGAPVEVTYAYGSDGRVRVRARDKTGGKEAAIEIERRGGLDEQQIDNYAALAGSYLVE
ncbi:MAG: heat-shock protein Hsp70 [Planctomycetia bacterium 21-64-5]|nr:MAG: heat-shock protein Hsp70 [Planctomycetia bacterium 21-64-5]HQU41377.1 Hsp70 family protein [Pirellulales bacterium]